MRPSILGTATNAIQDHSTSVSTTVKDLDLEPCPCASHDGCRHIHIYRNDPAWVTIIPAIEYCGGL